MGSRRQPDAQVLAAIVTQLRTTTTPSYVEVPQGTAAPYNKITSVTGRRTDTYGRFGKTMTVDVDAVTLGESQLPGAQQRDAVVQALDFQRLSMSTHTMLGLSYDTDTYFPEIVNAVKYHHHVATFTVWTEQSSS